MVMSVPCSVVTNGNSRRFASIWRASSALTESGRRLVELYRRIEQVADHIIDTVTEYAPNFRDSIVGRMVLSPLDLERTFGLVGGDIMHGRMSLDQLWAARPVLGAGAYRAPIKGLYMCGAGTHPGGGVTGAPGHNAAKEILRDASLVGRLLRAHA